MWELRGEKNGGEKVAGNDLGEVGIQPVGSYLFAQDEVTVVMQQASSEEARPNLALARLAKPVPPTNLNFSPV